MSHIKKIILKDNLYTIFNPHLKSVVFYLVKSSFTFFLIIGLLFFAKNVHGSELCSPDGYSVVTINGMFTSEEKAEKNMDALSKVIGPVYNNQNIYYQYFLNPSHVAGLGDVFASAYQKLFDTEAVKDYDLIEMLNDASQKITTQKLLLVGHSQGNFYANSFYDTVADQAGGVPKKSIKAYGVASPASRVAGNGKYITSSTDSVIESLRWKNILYILPANENIKLSYGDNSNGHGFSDVYLKYRGDKIITDIKSALNKLKENDEQVAEEPCISPPELSTIHKAQKVILAVADPTANLVKGGIIGAYNGGAYVRDLAINTGKSVGNVLNKTGLAIGNVFKNLSANVVDTLPDGGVLATGLASTIDAENDNSSIKEEKTEQVGDNIETQPLPENSNQEENINEIIVEQKTEEDIVKDKRRHSGGGGGSSSTIEQDPILDPTSEPEPDPDPTSEPEPDPEIEPDPTPEIDPEDGLPPEEDPVVPPVELATFTIDEDTTWSAGEYNYENLIITNNAVLTLEGDPQSADDFKGVKINAVNLTVTAGASISADKKGYGPNQGPGAVQDTSPTSNLGAGYGGLSYSNENGVTYGSATEPIDLGSGGAGLNHGGGAIYIVVSDTITNDGIISSSGGESSSGGSIYVKAEKIKGSGVFRANGGQLYQTGYFKSAGGGGRIALYYDEWSFDGTVEAKGGCGSYDSWTTLCAGDGTAGAFDVSTNDVYPKGSWKFLKDDGPFSFNDIFISDEAKVSSENDVSITANNIYLDDNSSFALAEGQNLDVPIIYIDGGSTFTLSGDETLTTDTLTVAGNSTVTVIKGKILSLEIPNIIVENGSVISANGKGYKNGPGTPSLDMHFAGASHGGIGDRNLPTSAYGSEAEPVDLGSGGYGNFLGGGAIRLIVDNSLVNDGVISADGEFTSSGGSVYITAKEISGGGIFSANGGGSYLSSIQQSPGGGGRVAIYYDELLFTGQVLAYGGTSLSDNPGTGTIKMVDTSVVTPNPDPTPDPDPDPTPDPDPEPGVILPSITSYIFNGVSDDVTINSLADVTSLVFIANKNVDWVSIKIEKEDDESIFKSLRESGDCADGTDTCTKTWNALLAGDMTAPNGVYKVKVRIRDLSDETTDYDYFSPYTITVEIPEEVIPTPKPGLGAEGVEEGGEILPETL